MNISVIVATLGRREAAEDLVLDLRNQSRKPDRVIFAVTTPADAPAGHAELDCEVILCDHVGSCVQRNIALDHVASASDIVVFFDDDFIPDGEYLSRLEQVFVANPDIVGVTGLVVADGVTGAGIERHEAIDTIAKHKRGAQGIDASQEPLFGLYGCNMALRTSALGELRFDENLPLYGWLEDLDLTNQLLQKGRLVRQTNLIGVHRGIKAGRTSGIRLGYSQIANAMYLIRKGTAPKRHMYENMVKYLTVNLLRSLRPEPFIDRRGRLWGNLVGIIDILRGRSRPDRILDL